MGVKQKGIKMFLKILKRTGILWALGKWHGLRYPEE